VSAGVTSLPSSAIDRPTDRPSVRRRVGRGPGRPHCRPPVYRGRRHGGPVHWTVTGCHVSALYAGYSSTRLRSGGRLVLEASNVPLSVRTWHNCGNSRSGRRVRMQHGTLRGCTDGYCAAESPGKQNGALREWLKTVS